MTHPERHQAGLPTTGTAPDPNTAPAAPAGPAPGPPPSDPPERVGPYRVEGEVGRGGMGLVLRVRDPAFQRTLAVKVLLERYRGDPDAERRFLEEARLTGQLQHPGVPPVHEMGRLDDGRPFFSMKLVKGTTLAELLAGRKFPSEGLTRFVAVFASVCQAVGYAHSRGVIHRDLKPANVMVGAFGEVQVMDWGLAKLLSPAAEPSAAAGLSTLFTTRAGEDSQTQAGSVLGTPAYMAPEQARGEVSRVDERSDVFGLGAMLCQVLTGEPPYGGCDVHRRARQTDLADALARLDSCGADAELVALARRCLAEEPAGRPGHAGEVANAVAAYQAGVQERARRAELERAAAQARAEEEARTRRVAEAKAAAERRARRLTLGLACAALLLLAGAGAVAWAWQRHEQEARERRQRADAAVVLALNDARRLREQAVREPLGDAGRFREALAAAHRATELARTGDASGELHREAEDLAGELAREAEAAGRDRALLGRLLEVRGPREGPRFKTDEKGLALMLAEPSADEQFAEAFRDWGLDVDGVAVGRAAARLKGRPAAVVTEVVAALDEWAEERRRERPPRKDWRRLGELADALDDPGSRRRQLRAILAGGQPPVGAGPGRQRPRLRRLAAQVDPAREPVLGLRTLARALTVSGEQPLAERLLREGVRARPQEVVLYQALGDLLTAGPAPRWAEAVECYAAVRALRPGLGQPLAHALVRAGRVREGLALYGRLAQERPNNPWLHLVRGSDLYDLRRFAEAEAAWRRALRLRPDSAGIHTNLGNALGRQGKWEEAEAALREAIRLQPDLPEGHYNLGAALGEQGRWKEAEAACRKAIRLRPDSGAHANLGAALGGQGKFKEAEAALREAIRLQPDYPEAHDNLGNALSGQGRQREAEAAHRAALRLRPDFPPAYSNLGAVLYRQGRHKEAETACREAIRLQHDFPEAHANLGAALGAQGKLKEAEAAFREAIRLQPDYPEAHDGLGTTLREQGRYKEAEAALREAIRLKPDSPEAHDNLGAALTGQGRHREAEAAYREALRLKPDSAGAHINLGGALGRQGKLKEAEAAFRQAIRLQPDSPLAHCNLGNALYRQGKFKEAEPACREAIRLKPDYPDAHYNLGQALREQGRFAEALTELRRSHALGSRVPGWNYPSAQWVRLCQRLLELDRKLPALLRGDAEPAGPVERLEWATLCWRYKRLHATAARLADEAFAADPRLAADLNGQLRYNAACSAALASAGRAEDARLLPDKVALMFRLRALRWLRADLDAYAQLLEGGNPAGKRMVRERLAHWQNDPDLAPVRDRAGLAQLPADERARWRRLWAEVEGLRRRAGGAR